MHGRCIGSMMEMHKAKFVERRKNCASPSNRLRPLTPNSTADGHDLERSIDPEEIALYHGISLQGTHDTLHLLVRPHICSFHVPANSYNPVSTSASSFLTCPVP